MSTEFKLTEKVLKSKLSKNPELILTVVWDDNNNCFVMTIIEGDTRQVIRTWVGGEKTFRDFSKAKKWAEDTGFKRINFEEITL